MPTTTNKGYEVQVTGSNVGTWGDVLNNQMISYVDQNMGGLTTLSLISTNVILNASQSRDAILRCTGALLGNVQITTACVGFFFVENATSGSFTVTITNGVSGVAIPQNTRATLIADGTNGVRFASQYLGFVGGITKQVFNNVTVPTGWTIDASVNNGTLRLVSATGGGSGGSANFTDAFKSTTLVAANIPELTGTTSNPTTNPSAGTFLIDSFQALATAGSGRKTDYASAAALLPNHVHTVTLGTPTPTPLDLAVKYVDVVRGTLNG